MRTITFVTVLATASLAWAEPDPRCLPYDPAGTPDGTAVETDETGVLDICSPVTQADGVVYGPDVSFDCGVGPNVLASGVEPGQVVELGSGLGHGASGSVDVWCRYSEDVQSATDAPREGRVSGLAARNPFQGAPGRPSVVPNP